MTDREALQELTEVVDALPVECDGATRIVHVLLKDAGVPHEVYWGAVELWEGDSIPLHWWVKVGMFIIDYRARMWLPDNDDVPHGVFDPTEHPEVEYQGSLVSFTAADECANRVLASIRLQGDNR